MAVISTPQASRLSISYITGKDERGVDVIRSRTYNNIKSSALDQDVMDVASVLSGLQTYPVKSVTRINQVDLAQE
ncbi:MULTISPECIES: DUF1659 domain-containing protein [unclassified Thermoanaerobacterium]|uniref:DUF1659 domain-containing protein n=1 Tax=unclassified Thermoanaerobacterium TaxID=2622527 RepID=UPI000A14F9DE|nr:MULTISPECIES: DUF1659 domain-containing protein [unclassified Thermoanaerobacterium]MDE4542801.1 DUF1659 domain-containing protein [Thermoanaerobacterium sp. R66]ORX22975.1 hypothetical protein BVF91_09135 [Thermoanaerobacterium sp. PSU-2]HHV74784.1 DUF1659 domain-containing protein [Thermoanaerobacterium sp.]